MLSTKKVARFPKRVQAPWSHTEYTTFGVFMPLYPVVPGCTRQLSIKKAKEIADINGYALIKSNYGVSTMKVFFD